MIARSLILFLLLIVIPDAYLYRVWVRHGRRSWPKVAWWAVSVLLAFCLTRLTDLDIVRIYFCVQFIDVVKLFIGLVMLRSDFWARNVVKDD